MQPGILSETGFLAGGETVRGVIEQDARTLKELGVTHVQFADRLEALFGYATLAAEDGNDRSSIDDLELQLHSWMGYQMCPFFVGDERLVSSWCGKGSRDLVITDAKRGLSASVPELAIHMIRDHSFFQGSTPYRVDPRSIAELLTLRPGVRYTPVFEEVPFWGTRVARGLSFFQKRRKKNVIERRGEELYLIAIRPEELPEELDGAELKVRRPGVYEMRKLSRRRLISAPT